jgi:Na+/H+ antiporter NhaC
MFLVHNEQTKLTAGWLNTLATAIIATGALAPIAAAIYGISQPTLSWIALSALSATCFALGAFIHLLGRLALRRLHE